MAYDPFGTTERDRSRKFTLMWLGIIAALTQLALYFADPAHSLSLTGLTAGGLVGASITYRSDDYFRALCAAGQRWVTMTIALYLFSYFMLQNLSDHTHSRDHTLPPGVPAMFGDAYLLGLILAAAFCLGYTWAWFRGR